MTGVAQMELYALGCDPKQCQASYNAGIRVVLSSDLRRDTVAAKRGVARYDRFRFYVEGALYHVDPGRLHQGSENRARRARRVPMLVPRMYKQNDRPKRRVRNGTKPRRRSVPYFSSGTGTRGKALRR